MTNSATKTTQKPELVNDVNAASDEIIKIAGQGSALKPQKEINGPKGLEPTRYGDWESKGRCYDF